MAYLANNDANMPGLVKHALPRVLEALEEHKVVQVVVESALGLLANIALASRSKVGHSTRLNHSTYLNMMTLRLWLFHLSQAHATMLAPASTCLVPSFNLAFSCDQHVETTNLSLLVTT